ncbi:MAG: hypothetical protein QE263_06180, partial [Vampirovibrionales bacterium]|nr:hypothetical protein [Vampirovibrionales bacterium]
MPYIKGYINPPQYHLPRIPYQHKPVHSHPENQATSCSPSEEGGGNWKTPPRYNEGQMMTMASPEYGGGGHGYPPPHEPPQYGGGQVTTMAS